MKYYVDADIKYTICEECLDSMELDCILQPLIQYDHLVPVCVRCDECHNTIKSTIEEVLSK